MSSKPDDLEAVRTVVDTLSAFDATEQERILRWSREKLGLPTDAQGNAAVNTRTSIASPDPPYGAFASRSHDTAADIKSFIAEKIPSSDNQFAAAVAYYYRFEAPEAARKETITADDLQEACRLAGRSRIQNPAQTLINAHYGGLLDKAGDRGTYSISTVGENLVAMALPSGAGKKPRSGKKSTTKRKGKTGSDKKPAKKSKA
jgi:hypothetical protein